MDVIAAIKPLSGLNVGLMAALPDPRIRESRRRLVLDKVRTRLAQLEPPPTDWPVHVQVGVPSTAIADRAQEVGADLILAGLSGPRPIHRILGHETVLEILHLSPLPVLAVPGPVRSFPDSALIAVDFSHFGDRAAQVVATLLAKTDHVHLAHVFTGFDEAPSDSQEWRAHFEDEARDRLERLARELGFSTERTDIHMLEGDPASELLGLVDELDVQLLVAGTHGHSFLGRLLLGSVSTRFVRQATLFERL